MRAMSFLLRKLLVYVFQHYLLFASVILIFTLLVGCSPSAADLEAVDYSPLSGDDWEVSTPEEEGAEKYFNDGSIDKKTLIQSAAKSYISALIGLALEQGCLTSLDQKMIDFFPEYADEIADPRKKAITLRQMLQMRSGYPWEETHPDLVEAMFAGDHPPLIVHFPLTADPFWQQHDSQSWNHEKAIINLVSEFIGSLPSE